MSHVVESVSKRLKGSTPAEVFLTLAPSEKDGLALAYLDELKARLDRAGQLQVERAATGVDLPPPRPETPEPDRRTKASAPLPSRSELYDRPEVMYDEAGVCRLGNQERQAFRKWAGRGGRNFADWLARAEAAVKPRLSVQSQAWFEADWYPGGAFAYHEMKRAEQLELRLSETVARVVAETRLELTRDLLHTEFALGTGEKVTWGDATADQHEQRAALLRLNSVANVDAESRHRKAIEMLRDAGASRLSELAIPAQAA